jgi:hypothetical protein
MTIQTNRLEISSEPVPWREETSQYVERRPGIKEAGGTSRLSSPVTHLSPPDVAVPPEWPRSDGLIAISFHHQRFFMTFFLSD